VALRAAQRLFEVRLQLGMDRDRFLVVAFRKIPRPRVADENEVARHVDVAALEARQLALAQTSVDGRRVERSPEGLDLQERGNNLVRFEEGWLPLRFPPPADALGRVRAAPLFDADGRCEDAVYEPAHVVHVGRGVFLLLRKQEGFYAARRDRCWRQTNKIGVLEVCVIDGLQLVV